MNNNIHFYASTKNDYTSPVSLWSVARVSVNNEGVRWLETQWTGGSDLQGMALYVSALDAAIAAEVLNKSGGTQEWQVYPFADLNITEMMIAMKARKPEYCIMLAFGFSIDDFRHLVLHCELYRSLQFPETFLISDGLNPVSNQAILKFNESLFDEMNKYWHEEFANYCESMEYQNSLSEYSFYPLAYKNKFADEISNKAVLPKFDSEIDNTNGLVIAVHDTWATHITLESLEVDGDSYHAKVHYRIQDHFGLDDADVLNPVYREFRIFRLWFALQRWDKYGYKPFITEMNATIEISGRRGV